MASNPLSLRVRPARPADAVALCEVLNAIVEIGGTTAIEDPLTVAEFGACFLAGARHLCCLVAEDEATGRQFGFQALEQQADLPADWGDIATFARTEPKLPGVGTLLFGATKARAHELGLAAINATIRADNKAGLAYYSKMGFETYKVDEAMPLKDGTPVDRVSKRYLMHR